MPKTQKDKNPFRQFDPAMDRLMRMLRARKRAKKRRRAEIELPGFTPDPDAPPGEEVWNAPGFGPPPKTGAQASLRELTRRSNAV